MKEVRLHYTQAGENKEYPESVLVWKVGDKVPEWLSDRAKVKFIDADGNITLETTDTTSGGLEIHDTSGTGSLVKLKKKTDLVCCGDGRIFSLSPVQFGLLYKLTRE